MEGWLDGRSLQAAAVNRFSLVLLGLLLAGAALAGSCWLAVAAAFTYGAGSLALSRQPAFRAALRRGDQEAAARLPAPEDVRDGAVRAEVYAFRHARAELLQLAREDGAINAELVETVEATRELERIAAGLVRHADDIYVQLERCSAEAVRRQIERLADVARFAGDPEAAQHYAAACALRGQQLAALDELARLRERDLAALSRVVASLHAARARTLRVRARRGEDIAALIAAVPAELATIDGELAGCEQVTALLER
jgi:hypothetical protein